MKAKVNYKVNGLYRTATIDTEVREPNTIVRAFIATKGLAKSTYISSIKCGNRIYAWQGTAQGAY